MALAQRVAMVEYTFTESQTPWFAHWRRRLIQQNKRRCLNVGLMLDQRRERYFNIDLTLVKRLLFTGYCVHCMPLNSLLNVFYAKCEKAHHTSRTDITVYIHCPRYTTKLT